MSNQPSGSAGPARFISSSKDPVTQPVSITTQEESTIPEVLEPKAVPEMGMPKVVYGFKKLFNDKATPPNLSKKEAEIVRRRTVRSESIEKLRLLSDEVPTLGVAFIGIKGGAATTTTMIHSASIMADLTRTMLVASDFNPASGTAGVRLGKDYGETMTLKELKEILDTIEAPADIIPRLRPTRYGVRVLSANDYTADPSESYGTTTKKMLEILKRYSEYHFIDTANDITTPSMKEVLSSADVLVFTANASVKDSLPQLGTAMQAARISFGAKVANSIAVISNIPEGKTAEDYRKYTDHVNSKDEVVEKYGFRGPILTIPHDPLVARDTEVDLEVLGWETYQAYLDLNLRCLEHGKTTLRSVSPLPFRSAFAD